MTQYTLTPQSAKKIAETIDMVQGRQSSQEGWYPYRSVRRQRVAGASIIIGKTTALWAKGSSATVAVWAGDPLADTGTTTTAMNLFADLEADRWVALLGGYLISAECNDPTP